MSIVSNLDLILRVPLFAMMTPEQASALSESVGKRRFKRGELIVEQGKKTDTLFIMLTGRARVVIRDRNAREVILASLKPGDYIGEISLIDNSTHSANVEAEVQTDVLMLGRAEFIRCLSESPAMAFAVMQGLVQRLRKADEKISSLALMDVYGRVAKVLIGLAEEEGDNTLIIREKLSRQDIAKMVGASREMVSRVMRDFEEKGFMHTLDNGAIVLKERRAAAR